MNIFKVLSISLALLLAGFSLSGCENTSVSGSVSYGMGIGYGYPMYYGQRGYNHTGIVVVRPPNKGKPRPKPMPRPKPQPRNNRR